MLPHLSGVLACRFDSPKGQIISKRLLVSSDSSKKRTNEIGFFCLTVLKNNLFVRFLEESEDTKKSFRNYLTFNKRAGRAGRVQTYVCLNPTLYKKKKIGR
jgi:hypothetical protein